MNVRLVNASLIAGNRKYADGSEITLPDLDQVRREFDERLTYGADFRDAVLREVARV